MKSTLRTARQGATLQSAAGPAGATRNLAARASDVSRRPIVVTRVATRPGEASTALRNEASAAAAALERSLALPSEGSEAFGGDLGQDGAVASDAASASAVAPLASTSSSSPSSSALSSAAAAAAAPPSPAAAASLADRKNPGASADELASTWEHRAWVAGTSALLLALAAQGAGKCLEQGGEGGGLLSVAAALGASYLLSDFLTAVYHWSVDNYGDGDTPLVGGQIAAFQGHHQKPWTITQREFANNLHKVFAPFAPVAALLLVATNVPVPDDVFSNFFSSASSSSLSSSHPLLSTSGFADLMTAATVSLGCMSQQFHAWSHMKKSQLPAAVVALQDAGVLVSRKAHGAHHRAPFEGNYAIVSGLWNPLLDLGACGADGEARTGRGFFRTLERAAFAATGVEPRCWSEPNYEWVDESGAVSSDEE